MPLLRQEIDIFPSNLFEAAESSFSPWWAMYTLARHEKKLMRELVAKEISFFGPTIGRRYRAPNGRLRTSIEPLFPNYVFVCGEEVARYTAVCTGVVSRWMSVTDTQSFVSDLKQIRDLIATDAPLAPERRIEAGQIVRVRNGAFKGFEGTVIRRENEIRLLIHVRYMGQGASVALDDCQVDVID